MYIFNITLEFDHNVFRKAVEQSVAEKGKGYVCVVDGNVLTMAQENQSYREIVNNAYINTCDGSSIAAMCNRIYGTNYTAFTGPHLFSEYIEKKEYIQLLLGNTEKCFNQIKVKLKEKGKTSDHLSYMPVPFAGIDEFDFKSIGDQINNINPDLIWVSLGAPKQEMFCARLLKYIDRGLLFGIGAAFNFYVGESNDPSFHIGALRFVWLDRLFREPKKQIKRVWTTIKVFPAMYFQEVKRKRDNCKKCNTTNKI